MAGKLSFDAKLGNDHGDEDETSDETLAPDVADAYDNELGSPLHYAAMWDDAALARHLIKHGADVNYVGHKGTTPLMLAVQHYSVDTVNVLIDANADIDIVNDCGDTVLKMMFRRRYDNFDIFQAILQRLQCKFNNVEQLVDKLIEVGCEMTYSVLLRDIKVMECFLKRGYSIQYDSISYGHDIPLKLASYQNEFRLMKWLIDNGAYIFSAGCPFDTVVDDIEPKDNTKKWGYSPVYLALCDKFGKSIQKSIYFRKDVFENCRSMLDVVMYENLSLYDLLIATDYRIRVCARNETFVPTIKRICAEKDMKNEAPYYFKSLMRRIASAVDEVKLENIVIPIICDIFNLNPNGSYILAREVTGYLRKCDLKNFSRVYEV